MYENNVILAEDLDPRLRGDDNKSKQSVIPAKAGIQFVKLSWAWRHFPESVTAEVAPQAICKL